MRKIGHILVAAGLGLAASAHAGSSASPKINLRLINGSAGLKANPNVKPITFIGGLDVNLIYYLTGTSGISLGYTLVMDLAGSSVPLQGANLGYRYHFLNQGTRVGHKDDYGILSEQPLWSLYGTIVLGNRAYFFKTHSTTRGSVSGASTYVQPGIGGDFNWGENWELNFELGMPLMSFASSSSGGLGGFFAYAGINYYW